MSQTSGNSSTPVLAIVGAVALSVVLFFAFTLPQCSGKKDEVAGDSDAQPVGAGAGTTTDTETEQPEPEPVVEPEPEPEAVAQFGNPRELMGSLVGKISSGDVDGVKELIGEDVLASPGALGFLHAFGPGGYKPAADAPFGEIGDVDEMNRWAIYAERDGVEGRERITVDLKKAPQVGWQVAHVHVPSSLRKAAVVAGVKLPDGSTAVVDDSLDRADPLFVADDFVGALLSQNFEKALGLCGDKVPDEKIAGLCMVFEEGQFQMLKEKPLTTTSLGKDKAAAWVFARVRSEKMDANGEFAVELKRDDEKGWEVENVNIESMLQDFVANSEAGRVPFTPD